MAVRARVEVLLIDFLHWLGLTRLPSTLQRAGCRLTVFGPPGGHLLRSRHVADFIAASADITQALDQLRDHLRAHPGRYRWILFGDEAGLNAAAERRHEPWLQPCFPVEIDRLDLILSKAAFAATCQKQCIPFPRTILCNRFEEVEAAAQEVGYPFILKNPLGQGGKGVRKVETPAELPAAFAPWATVQPLLVQQLMTGCLGASEILYDRGQLRCWFASYLDGCWPPPYGPSSIRGVMTHPRMEEILQRLGSMLGYHGFCGIDWFHDPRDDSLVVLEFNPRPTTSYHLGHFAGVDFARSLRGMLQGKPVVQRPNGVGRRPQRVYLFPQHLQRCVVAGELGELRHWLPFAAAHDVPWDEPWILLRHLLRIGRLSLLHTWGRVRDSASTSR